MRLTVEDDATGVKTDVHIDCEPSDRVADVLALVSAVLPVRGTPEVDGEPLPLEQAVAASPLRDGALLSYGRRPRAAPGRAPALVLRVVSGAAAGTELPLVPGRIVVVGRAVSCDLVLDDPDVSRRHAQLVVGPRRVTLADLGSRNGVLLDGRAVAGAADVTGKVVQIGGSRLVVESPRNRAAVVAPGEAGELLFHRTPRSRPQRIRPPAVVLPARPADGDRRSVPLLVRRGRRAEEAYRSELTAALARIEAATDDEDAELRAAWPDPATTVRTATEPGRELWQRRPRDGDWLAVGLGRADRPAGVRVTGDPPEGWSPPGLRLAPVGVGLVEHPVLGLAGPPGPVDAGLAWVVIQLAVHHGPDELRLAVIAPDADEEQLGWMRWLPHLRSADGSIRAGWDGAGAERLIELLGDELRSGPSRPDLVVILAGTADLHRTPLPDLVARGPAAGLRFVCAETDERRLPGGAGARLVTTGRDAVLRVGGSEARPLVPDGITAETAERVARSLAPLRVEPVEPAVEPAASLRRAVALRWFDVAPPPHAPTAVPASRPET